MVFLFLCLSLSGVLSVLLLFAFRLFGVCSSSIVRLLFGVGFSLPSVSLSPRGQKNLLLQAAQVEWKLFCCLGLGVYYVR